MDTSSNILLRMYKFAHLVHALLHDEVIVGGVLLLSLITLDSAVALRLHQ